MQKNIIPICVLIVMISTVKAQQSGVAVNTVGTLSRINTEKKVNEAELKSKEISREIAMPKNSDIRIDNISRNIVVKTWNQPKVKISTTVFYEGDSRLTDDEWFEKINLSLKTLGNSVKIKSGGIQGNNFYSFGTGANAVFVTGNADTYFNSTGESIGTRNNKKATVTVTVPLESKLDIESKYADIALPDNIGDLNVDISNGNMEAGNLKKFILRSKYANINVSNVKEAEVELANGRLSAGNIDELDFDTKNSTIELANTQKAVIRSMNDEYEFEEAGEISGRKNYGNFRITKLIKSIELEGTNSDIKIRNLASTVSQIKIDGKYADIRIPLKAIKNYSIDFTGAYSAVYGNFEKKALPVSGTEGTEIKPTVSVSGKLVAPADMTKITTTGSTSKGTLSVMTVTGVLSEAKVANTTTGTSISFDEVKPTITSVGTLTNVSVTGVVTPANVQPYITGTTIPGAASTIAPGSKYISSRGSSGTLTGGTIRPTGGSYYYASDNDTPAKFAATAGDGKNLKIEMKCQNCTVDFK